MNVYMACSCGVGTGRLIGDSKYSRVRVKVDAVTIKHTITQPPITSQAHGTNSISRGLSIAVHTETKNINMIQRVRPPTSSVILIQVSRSIQPAGKQGSTLSHRISSSPLHQLPPLSCPYHYIPSTVSQHPPLRPNSRGKPCDQTRADDHRMQGYLEERQSATLRLGTHPYPLSIAVPQLCLCRIVIPWCFPAK